MTQVLGFYEKGNIGDNAYQIAFPKLFPNEEFRFGDTISGKPDTIILGGGDVFSPKFLDMLDKHPHAKKYALSVNIRPENLKYIHKFTKVIARNHIEGVQCLPDFTFILNPNPENGKKIIQDIFKKHKSDLYENVIIITLNSFLCFREKILARDYVAFEKICFDLAKIMDNMNASFLLVPFGNGFPHNDRIANSFVYTNAKFWKKNVLLFDELSVQETLDVFSAAKAAITTRLHAAIFSCLGHIPFIDITHHSKNKMFMEFINKKEWSFDFWHFDYHKAKELLNEFITTDYNSEVTEIDGRMKKLLSGVTL